MGAGVGDRVVLKVDTSPLLKATFLIYLFPILMLLAGAGVGEWLSHSVGWGSSMPAAVFGFGSLAAGLVLVRVWGRRLSQQSAYRPRIIRVIGRARLESQADEESAG
jgi:sigma-E factor negative regulatory protein RseC